MRQLVVLVALALVASDALAQTRATSGGVRLSGTVIAGDTAEPIAGADVRILETGARTFTAIDGYFEFDALPPGAYTAVASRLGYMTTAAGARSHSERPQPVELAAGSARHVEIRLTARGTITGRILDETGAPARDVMVRAVRQRTRSPNVRTGAAVTVDDDGAFTIRGLDPGRYYVVAAKRSRLSTRPVVSGTSLNRRDGDPEAFESYYPGTAVPGQAMVIAVDAGSTADASFTMARPPLAQVTGTIVDASGRPPGHVTLNVSTTGPPAGTTPASMSYSIDDGRFVITGLPPADYRIEAITTRTVLPENSPLQLATGHRTSDASGASATVTLQITGEDVTGVALHLTPGFTVTGRLVNASGEPLAMGDVPLTLTLPSVEGRQQTGFTASDGSFTFGATPGRYLIRVRPPNGDTTLFMERAMVGTTDVTDEGLEVLANTQVDVVLTPPTQLKGVVQLRQGRALPNTWVVVFGENPRLWSLQDSRFVRTAVSSATGEFDIVGLPPGSYYAAVPGGMLADESDVRSPPDLDDLSALIPGATRFSIGAGERKSLLVTFD